MFQVTLLLALVSFVLGDFDADLHDKYMTMSREEFIEYFNSQNYNFKIGSAPELHESSTSCVYMDEETFNNLPRIYHSPAVIAAAPESFDARQQWPSCGSISEVYNQGACGSCWTFGTATVASDRTCIGLGVDVRLSEQDFECLTKDVCKGYYPQEAFNFWTTQGLVTQECKPYDIDKLKYNQTCTRTCVDGSSYESNKHYGASVYSVASDDGQIIAELFQNGPIEAVFTVFDDFRNYKSGVYEHMYGGMAGAHSVRVLGYGVENGVPYWLAVNSYGRGWGEGGYFKVKRFASDIGFENQLLAGRARN
ncbi:cathepsin B-like [Manduca sexta]|uniref:cathepsin B-like n=1 Tax=Manduca sexta TaxID=7130 RepID=UPI00188FE3EB|nr:cathepsin B-like [Manduca sexta]